MTDANANAGKDDIVFVDPKRATAGKFLEQTFRLAVDNFFPGLLFAILAIVAAFLISAVIGGAAILQMEGGFEGPGVFFDELGDTAGLAILALYGLASMFWFATILAWMDLKHRGAKENTSDSFLKLRLSFWTLYGGH